ncbi:acyltransferase [Rhizobium sp. LC145]|uniref:acyltransferase family protein n=1 Tax=Rhizobium sp. LC145 TaxID=1120688 RepID=UPI000629DEF6|nr:acyltransferase [Rhizobium sp. LC145]KKX25411.1 hypothetical protein YH62_26145 [Rhizobium sp. LC145]
MHNRYDHLDGLRGLAALAVLLGHLEALILTAASTQGVYPGPSGILPSLYLALTSGTLAVAIFFILSGFVLIKKFDETRSSRVLLGAAVKRYFRLTPPIFASMVLAYLLYRFIGPHTAEASRIIGGHGWLEARPNTSMPLSEVFEYGLFSTIIGRSAYNGVLWTMNIEFAGSLLLFCFAAVFYSSPRYILIAAVTASVSVLAFGETAIHLSMFLLGSTFLKFKSLKINEIGAITLICIGLFAGAVRVTWPEFQSVTALLSLSGNAANAFQLAINSFGAALIVTAACFCPTLQSKISGAACRYLGRISFSLYLIHLPVYFTIGAWTITELAPFWGVKISSAVACLVVVGLSLLIAHFFAATVDKFAMKLADGVGAGIISLLNRQQPTFRHGHSIGSIPVMNSPTLGGAIDPSSTAARRSNM